MFQIYSCSICHRRRTYGFAVFGIEFNVRPYLLCQRCNRHTEHNFIANGDRMKPEADSIAQQIRIYNELLSRSSRAHA